MTITDEPHFTTGNVAAFALCEERPEGISLRKLIEDADPDFLKKAQITSDHETSLDGSLDGIYFSMMAVAGPYPDDELQHYCGHNIIPQDAWAEASGAACHVAIVVRGQSGQSPSREAVLLAGRIVLAFSPLAVLWSPAKCVFRAEAYRNYLQEAQGSGSWPHQAMVAVADPQGGDALHTRGLVDFLGHEVAVQLELGSDALLSIAAQLLNRDTPLEAGDTILSPCGKETLRAHAAEIPGGIPALDLHVETHETEEDQAATSAEPSKTTSERASSEVASDTEVAQEGPDQASEAEPPQDEALKAQTKVSRPIRARIVKKQEKIVELSVEHRSKEQRNVSKIRQDPRDTIESTLAAIRAASANAEPEEKPAPKWMFWKR